MLHTKFCLNRMTEAKDILFSPRFGHFQDHDLVCKIPKIFKKISQNIFYSWYGHTYQILCKSDYAGQKYPVLGIFRTVFWSVKCGPGLQNSKTIPSPIPVPHTKFQSNPTNTSRDIVRKLIKMAGHYGFFWKFFRSPNRSQYGRGPKISLPRKFRDDRSSSSFFGFFACRPLWIGGFCEIFRNSQPAHSLWHPAEPLSPIFWPDRSNGSGVHPSEQERVSTRGTIMNKLAAPNYSLSWSCRRPGQPSQFSERGYGRFWRSSADKHTDKQTSNAFNIRKILLWTLALCLKW